jgi:hypothetical protein
MNRSKWIATAVSGLVLAGLVALAAPLVADSVAEVSTWRTPFSDATAATESVTERAALVSTPSPTPSPTPTPTPDGTHGDCALLYYPRSYASPALDAPVDNGPREFASGEAMLQDGIPTTYTVAPGDAMQAIGARFCTFSVDVFYLNDVHLQGAIQPGDVLRLRP